jgi:aminocarboxymuconate-semialdehyde decarboxylase
VIDVHSHVIPPTHPNAGGDPRWPTLEVGQDSGVVVVSGRPYRHVIRAAWDMDRRAEIVRQSSLVRQVISIMPEYFCHWSDAGASMNYYDHLNEWVASAVSAHPDVFDGFGIVPLQDPAVAVDVLQRVSSLGLRGIIAASNVEGVSLAQPRFHSVLERAGELGLVVFVHAFHPLLPPCGEVPVAVDMAVRFPLEIGYVGASFVATGFVASAACPTMCLSHGGGSLTSVIDRLQWTWDHVPGARAASDLSPLDLTRRFYVDSVVFSEEAMARTLAVMGHDRVVVGSDYPFIDRPFGVDVGPSLELSKSQYADIYVGNAQRLLGLPSGAGTHPHQEVP